MAITQYYVDPAIAGDSGTGAIGDPFGDLQYALNTITRDATNGDQINIKAGTAEVLAASLTLATYGTPTDAAPLVLRGYTATANDGGIGDLDGNAGAFNTFASNYNYVHLVYLTIRNVGNAALVLLGTNCQVIRCTVYGSTSATAPGISVGVGSVVAGCYVHTCAYRGINMLNAASGLVYGNYVVGAAAAFESGITINGSAACPIIGNIVVLNENTCYGINVYRSNPAIIHHNIIYSAVASTSSGIFFNATNGFGAVVQNNIVIGFSGAGGKGILADGLHPFLVGYNAFYNNTANETYNADPIVDLGNDVTLAADPFTDAANGDFSLTAAAKTALAAKGWPTAYLGAHANTVPNLNIGPIQLTAGSCGGGRRQQLRVHGG